MQEVVTINEQTSTEYSACPEKMHPIENSPKLPRHPNCRCCLVPVIGTRLTHKEAEKRMVSLEMSNQLGRLSDNEKEAITEMSHGLSQKINNSIYSSNIKPELKDKINIVDQSIAKREVTRDITVTRVTDVRFLDAYTGGRKVDNKAVLNLKGKVVTNPIYSSTSLNEDFRWVGRNTVIRLDVPKGTKNALHIKELAVSQYKHQEEILFCRNLQYEIVDVIINEEGTILLKAKVIGFAK